jgi:cell division protein FtsB
VSALQSNQEEPEGGGLWASLNRFLAVLITITILAVVGYRYLPELGKRREQEAKIESLINEISKQERRLALQTLEEKLLKRDPEYAGLKARDQLDLMKEGETIYRIEPSRPDPSKMHRNP